MENLTDAILSISLDEGDAYVDDQGRMQMDLKIYTYDKYDMVDIANLKVGDTVVTECGITGKVISVKDPAVFTTPIRKIRLFPMPVCRRPLPA